MRHLPQVPVRGAFADLKAVLTQPIRHKWGIMGVCAAMTWFLAWAFVTEFTVYPKAPKPELTYVTRYAPGRTDAQVHANNVAVAVKSKREADALAQAEAERRASAKRLYDMLHTNGLY